MIVSMELINLVVFLIREYTSFGKPQVIITVIIHRNNGKILIRLKLNLFINVVFSKLLRLHT